MIRDVPATGKVAEGLECTMMSLGNAQKACSSMVATYLGDRVPCGYRLKSPETVWKCQVLACLPGVQRADGGKTRYLLVIRVLVLTNPEAPQCLPNDVTNVSHPCSSAGVLVGAGE